VLVILEAPVVNGSASNLKAVHLSCPVRAPQQALLGVGRANGAEVVVHAHGLELHAVMLRLGHEQVARRVVASFRVDHEGMQRREGLVRQGVDEQPTGLVAPLR